MRTSTVALCAAILLAAQAAVFAQKTEVHVQRGKVIAETADKSIAVDAGRKVIIAPNGDVTAAVDDPMVDDVMKIYRWVEQEKQAQEEKIETTSIQNIRIESESRFTLAYLLEKPNTTSQPSDVCRVTGVCGTWKAPRA